MASKLVRHCRFPIWSPDSQWHSKGPEKSCNKKSAGKCLAQQGLSLSGTLVRTLFHVLENCSPKHRLGVPVQGKGLVLLQGTGTRDQGVSLALPCSGRQIPPY